MQLIIQITQLQMEVHYLSFPNYQNHITLKIPIILDFLNLNNLKNYFNQNYFLFILIL